MNFFENRVESFRNNTVKWPHSNKPHNKVELFANAGFYFVRRPKVSDNVRCFLCDIELSHWKPGQSPYIRHATESPHCPWAVMNFPDAPQRTLTGNDITTQPRSTTMRAARLATFNNHNYWPPSKGRLVGRKFQAASKLADAGFYYSPNLDNLARIKCPYCKTCILEPEKSLNVLEKHQELNSSCIFFEQTHNIRSKNRRGTITSSTSTETFRTASSKLSNDCYLETTETAATKSTKRKNEELTSEPSTKQRKKTNIFVEAEETKPSSKDDSFWDIRNTFSKTVAPSQVRKPAITFGKKPTARDRPRDRLLHSNAKQAGTVNIFSPPTVKADPVSLIVKPVTKEASKLARLPAANAEPTKKRVVAKKPESKLIAQVKTASSVIKAEKSASAPSPPEPKVPSQLIKRNDSFSGENELPDTVTVLPPKKDKGKGRAVEPIIIISPYSTKKGISLSKSKPTKYTTTALPAPTESSFSMRSPSMESSSNWSNNIPSFPPINESVPSRSSNVNMYSPTRTQSIDPTIVSSSPKRSALQIEPEGFDVDLPQTPASRAIAAQKIKYLQSTPAQSTTSKIQQRSTVSASAIFGDCPFSPIVPISQNKEDDAIFQNTPVIASGRARPIIDMATEDDEYEVMDEREKRRRFRAISPPKSPTRIDASTETPPVLTMDEIFAHVSLGQITEEEKNMTVENYLRHIVDTNIDKVRKHGDTLIDMIQAKSDRIKSQLLQQQQEK